MAQASQTQLAQAERLAQALEEFGVDIRCGNATPFAKKIWRAVQAEAFVASTRFGSTAKRIRKVIADFQGETHEARYGDTIKVGGQTYTLTENGPVLR